jgi:beta-galactosidase/beta-glucuronidase
VKILSLNFEILRATTAVAEFVVRVQLDGPAAGCVVEGTVTGPRRDGVSTVELSYPMTVTDVGDTAVTLRCVIPEPNLWTPDAPYRYGWTITAEREGEEMDQRVGGLVLKESAG